MCSQCHNFRMHHLANAEHKKEELTFAPKRIQFQIIFTILPTLSHAATAQKRQAHRNTTTSLITLMATG